MVRVTGQLDAPVVDMGAVRQDFWERKTIVLPSLARLHKPKGWFSWFKKQQAPRMVLRRIKASEWEEIQTVHADRRLEIAKGAAKMKEITERAEKLEEISGDEKKFIIEMNHLSQPILYSMISAMAEEPKLNYDDTVMFMESLDDYDRKTILGVVNAMTSQQANAMKAIYDERTADVNRIKDEMLVKV